MQRKPNRGEDTFRDFNVSARPEPANNLSTMRTGNFGA